MHSSNTVFNLIHSMTKAEKAWFKKFAAASADGKDTQYMQLYEYFNQMTGYSEEKLKKTFTANRSNQ